MNANAKEIEKYNILNEGLKSARASLDIARDKYLQGLTDFNNVLTAQQDIFSAEDACVTSEGQKIINLINLFKALGGRWGSLR